jgi:glycosyltransferase involved in cell wall biosynthesis
MISRSTLFTAPGGDTIQIKKTAEYLRKLGIHIDIKLSDETIDYTQYDLMHFFNIIRPNDILQHIQNTKLPFVVSSIFVDYSEYEKIGRKGMIKYINKLVNSDQLEYLKVIARMIKNNEKLKSYAYLRMGQKKSMQYIIDKSSMLLPNSQSEYDRLEKHFQISKTYHIVPNAIDINIFKNAKENNKKYKDSIICVGRIEGLKNQLNLIKAVNQTHYKLFIIGKASPNQLSYYRECLQEANKNDNVEFIDHVDQEMLANIMQSAKVHVLASWFETTGLVSLEAAFLGCNIVITNKGDQTEYFEDMVTYCDPDDIDSIVSAIQTAYNTPQETRLREKILKQYLWENTAKETLWLYKQVLGKTK